MSFKKVSETEENRPEGRTCLLTHGLQPEVFDKICALAAASGIDEVLYADREHLETRIRTLIDELPAISVRSENSDISTHFIPKDAPNGKAAILFSGVSDAELHRFLGLFREAGLPRPLLAVVTDTSRHWKLSELLHELTRERESMQAK